jgi:hypothetical protein
VLFDKAISGDLSALLGNVMQNDGKAMAVKAGWDGETRLAEAFRWSRFGERENLFATMAKDV